MTGRYRTLDDHVICVVRKNNNSSQKNNVAKYQRSGKSKKGIQYVFEVPEQVFHFVSIVDNGFSNTSLINPTLFSFLAIKLAVLIF